MVQTIEAIFDGQVFRPADPLDLPSDTRCRLTVETLPVAGSGDVWSLLAQAAGSIEAPADWADQHDHYLYGTSKQEPQE